MPPAPSSLGGWAGGWGCPGEGQEGQRQSQGHRGPRTQYLQGVLWTQTHAQPHTHKGFSPMGRAQPRGDGGDTPAGGPRQPPLAYMALESGREGWGLPSSEPESSWRTGGDTGEKVPGRVTSTSGIAAAVPLGDTSSEHVPPRHTESGRHTGTQPNKLEAGWEGGKRCREGVRAHCGSAG